MAKESSSSNGTASRPEQSAPVNTACHLCGNRMTPDEMGYVCANTAHPRQMVGKDAMAVLADANRVLGNLLQGDPNAPGYAVLNHALSSANLAILDLLVALGAPEGPMPAQLQQFRDQVLGKMATDRKLQDHVATLEVLLQVKEQTFQMLAQAMASNARA